METGFYGGNMKKIALLIYPEFSMQEVADLLYLFRWGFDTKTVVISTSKEAILSEEGISVLPEKTVDEFHKEEYHCLILPGCSDVSEALKDIALFQFLHSLKDETEFVIGAICAGPMFLSMAHLLDDKKFAVSISVEVCELFTGIKHDHIVYEPVVIDGSIVTAQGDAFRQFAIAIARKVGFDCSDKAMSGVPSDWKTEDFIHHLTLEEQEEFQKEELPVFEEAYAKIQKALNK